MTPQTEGSMSQADWEKPKHPLKRKRSQRLQFITAGAVLLVSLLYLLVSGTLQGARYFITVAEVLEDPAHHGPTLRVSGAVDGESIDYDSENAIIRFEIVHIPSQYGDLAQALHAALSDDAAPRMKIVVADAAIPDLLQHEAQAILTGALESDGIFHASELLLKCPSRFEESSPPEALGQIPEHN
ncbi:MAG: cytochrome c maturation protein CcmE [Chloroflexi bacterium]|nr:cytochrome c maturation protein CcmE [Chloroflexota bacterium]MCY3581202.1 cytochrome c maturation protein CcmE [Chloroflexota bacterium]